MSFLNHIKIELFLLLIVTVSVFLSVNFDINIYNFFVSFNENSQNIYLKEFFVNITRLGESSWYFAISVIALITLFSNKLVNLFTISDFDKKINFFISVIIYLLTIGLTTQIIKHLVGRPRPNHTNFEENIDFNFFTLESSLHSFPSGHSSTIFMVCLILCTVLPKLKVYFFILASIIAFSRVVVGAHFLTDIIVGGLLALIVYKFLNVFFREKNKNYLFNKIVFGKNSPLYYFVIFLSGLCLFVSTGPSLDLFVASIFYHGNSQFSLQSFDLLSIIIRDILIPVILFYILIFPIISKYFKIKKIYFNYKFSLKEIFLIWFSQIFSVLIFINFILKNFWGRARPGDVIELDGKESFTPWYKITDACETNCSFVSGDASVGFSIIIFYLITKNVFFVYASIMLGFLLGFTRIFAGGHFLSDILFAGAIVILTNIIIFLIYKKYYDK